MVKGVPCYYIGLSIEIWTLVYQSEQFLIPFDQLYKITLWDFIVELPIYNIISYPNLSQFQASKKRKVLTEESSPAAEEGNYVRLNMKSKKYRRPGKAMTGEAYKRKQWKSRGLFGKGPPKDWKNPNKKPPPPKWVTGGSSKPGNCFKCGGEGHWASKCTGKKQPVITEVTPEEAGL